MRRPPCAQSNGAHFDLPRTETTRQHRIAKFATTALIALLAALDVVAQPVVLQFARFESPNAPFTARVFIPWAEEVTQASNGTLKIEVFPGGILGRNPLQQFKLVQDGVADMAWTAAGYTPGRFDDTEVSELPFLIENSHEGSIALTRLVARGELQGFTDLKMLFIGVVPPVHLHSKSNLKTIADLKGKRMRIGGSIGGQIVEALGAVPVLIGGPNAAEALAKGVVDGILCEWNFVQTFKIDEVVNHHLAMPLGGTTVMVPMLKTRFDALSAAGKAALERLGGEAFARRFAAVGDTSNATNLERVAALSKHTVTRADAALQGEFRKVLEPVTEKWRKAKPRNEIVYQSMRAEIGKVRAAK
jgi:TRAP-type C4-dicarboxylate transport system substrate-binding protein